MTNDRADIAHILNRLAITLALVVAILFPVSFGLIAYNDLSDSLSFKAKVKTAAFNGLIASSPDLWMYAENQMNGLIQREPFLHEDERIEVRDAQGALIAQSSPSALATPFSMVRSSSLFDAGRLVGHLEVSAPLRSVAWVTAAAALAGVLIGALLHTMLQILPLRALRQVTDALLDEKQQGDRLLEALRQREAALKESEARYRALHDASFGGIMIHDGERILDCNQNMADLVGCQVDELIGADFMQCVAPEWQDIVRQRAREGFSEAYEIEGVRRDGTRLPLSVHGRPIHLLGRDVRFTEVRDISEIRRSIEALRASEENLAVTLNSIGDAVVATDATGLVTRMNPAAEQLTGWTFREARGRLLAEVFVIVNAITREIVVDPVRQVIESGRVIGLSNDTVLLARGGEEYHIADSAAPIRNAAGEVVGVVLVISDVTEKYRTAASLHETQAILTAAMDQTPVGIAIANVSDGTIRYINKAGLALRGRGRNRNDFVSGTSFDEYCAGDSFFDTDENALAPRDLPLARATLLGEESEREFVVRHANGSEYVYVSRAAPIRDAHGGVVVAIGVFLDISEKKTAEEEIKRLAFFDQLTGLPNRRLLLDRLTQRLASQSRHSRGGALLFIDLDNFKTINDTAGHDAGDKLLKQVAEKLVGMTRVGDTVARLGGDEFVVLLDELSPIAEEAAMQAENVGEKILREIKQNYHFDDQAAYNSISASIGIALFEREIGVDELFSRADLAMYQAKNAGRNTQRFFDPEMQAKIRARLALEVGMREAIESDQFLLFYQPQVDATGAVVGAEALLRWQRGDGTLVQPGDFISLAEETGLILTIGEWVIDTACRHLAVWAQRPETEALSLSVNVSARQFHHPDFVAQVKLALLRSGANPRRLKLELTESQLLVDIDSVIAKMSVLRAAGVCFSLDDFGTGYSSLAYLKRLPLTQLKIDRSFVCDLLTDPDNAAIVRTIVALGDSLGLSVIAEGVESERQKTRLLELGCLHYQGYFFGRPSRLIDFERAVISRCSSA